MYNTANVEYFHNFTHQTPPGPSRMCTSAVVGVSTLVRLLWLSEFSASVCLLFPSLTMPPPPPPFYDTLTSLSTLSPLVARTLRVTEQNEQKQNAQRRCASAGRERERFRDRPVPVPPEAHAVPRQAELPPHVQAGRLHLLQERSHGGSDGLVRC